MGDEGDRRRFAGARGANKDDARRKFGTVFTKQSGLRSPPADESGWDGTSAQKTQEKQKKPTRRSLPAFDMDEGGVLGEKDLKSATGLEVRQKTVLFMEAHDGGRSPPEMDAERRFA